MAFKIKQHDTRPKYVVPLVDNYEEPDEEPINLTTLDTVNFIMRLKEAGGAPAVKEAAAVLGDPKLGIVQYTWSVGDTDVIGKYDVEFELVWEDGGIETVPNEGFFDVEVGGDLG